MNRFWILDFGFWIDARQRAFPIDRAAVNLANHNPKSKIQNVLAALRLVSLGLVLALSKATLADSVTFTSSAISLRKVTIQSLQGGQLIYLDSHGQRQTR